MLLKCVVHISCFAFFVLFVFLLLFFCSSEATYYVLVICFVVCSMFKIMYNE